MSLIIMYYYSSDESLNNLEWTPNLGDETCKLTRTHGRTMVAQLQCHLQGLLTFNPESPSWIEASRFNILVGDRHQKRQVRDTPIASYDTWLEINIPHNLEHCNYMDVLAHWGPYNTLSWTGMPWTPNVTISYIIAENGLWRVFRDVLCVHWVS